MLSVSQNLAEDTLNIPIIRGYENSDWDAENKVSYSEMPCQIQPSAPLLKKATMKEASGNITRGNGLKLAQERFR